MPRSWWPTPMRGGPECHLQEVGCRDPGLWRTELRRALGHTDPAWRGSSRPTVAPAALLCVSLGLTAWWSWWATCPRRPRPATPCLGRGCHQSPSYSGFGSSGPQLVAALGGKPESACPWGTWCPDSTTHRESAVSEPGPRRRHSSAQSAGQPGKETWVLLGAQGKASQCLVCSMGFSP